MEPEKKENTTETVQIAIIDSSAMIEIQRALYSKIDFQINNFLQSIEYKGICQTAFHKWKVKHVNTTEEQKAIAKAEINAFIGFHTSTLAETIRDKIFNNPEIFPKGVPDFKEVIGFSDLAIEEPLEYSCEEDDVELQDTIETESGEKEPLEYTCEDSNEEDSDDDNI